MKKTSFVFILADDLGLGDIGCYGGKAIPTPNIDRLAAEGLRFSNAYSASAVCAPTRCGLMTGRHMGHATRRANGSQNGQIPLAPEEITVAELLKQAGYATGGFGKWGLGNPGTTGTPDKHGFDHFFGYLDQVHAHDYYTEYLWRDGETVILEGNHGDRDSQYSHDLLAAAALDFIKDNKERPFFLYLPYTIPHGQHEVPSDQPYSDENWPQQHKNYAAMITRMDADIGEMLALLKELKIDERTIVFFTSDNGATPPFLERFHSSAGLRGTKRDLYEGGIRTPMIVRWPGRIRAGTESDFVWSQVDVLPTLADLAGVEPPAGLDGFSVLPTLLGEEQSPHEFLYWEIHGPFHQAVRTGNWKAVRFGTQEPLELYDLSRDPAEAHNVSAEHPEVVRRIEVSLSSARTESPYWPARAHAAKPRTR
ncbi:MAG: arylsulfatase [Planctomycetaceae bacterium]